jgi:hypothetical protein
VDDGASFGWRATHDCVVARHMLAGDGCHDGSASVLCEYFVARTPCRHGLIRRSLGAAPLVTARGSGVV